MDYWKPATLAACALVLATVGGSAGALASNYALAPVDEAPVGPTAASLAVVALVVAGLVVLGVRSRRRPETPYW